MDSCPGHPRRPPRPRRPHNPRQAHPKSARKSNTRHLTWLAGCSAAPELQTTAARHAWIIAPPVVQRPGLSTGMRDEAAPAHREIDSIHARLRITPAIKLKATRHCAGSETGAVPKGQARSGRSVRGGGRDADRAGAPGTGRAAISLEQAGIQAPGRRGAGAVRDHQRR
jgi:hypothetical protein